MGYYAKHRRAGSKRPVLRAVAASTALVLLVLVGTVFLTYRHLEGNITISNGFAQITQPRPEQVEVECDSRVVEHPHRRRMDDPGRLRDRFGKVAPTDNGNRLLREVRPHAGRQALRAVVIEIGQIEPGCTTGEERVCGRRAGAAAPDLHDAVE